MDNEGIHAFMVKEYEKCFELFDLHYRTSEKIFTFYIVLIGGFLGLLGFVYEGEADQVSLFDLREPIVYALFVIAAAGLTLFMMAVEHRIKIVFYVHAVNLLRRWFVHNSSKNLSAYLLLSTDPLVPKYFVFWKDFFWELLLFSVLSSTVTSLFLLNVAPDLALPGPLDSLQSMPVYLSMLAVLSLLHMVVYLIRGTLAQCRDKKKALPDKQETRVEARERATSSSLIALAAALEIARDLSKKIDN